MKQWRRAGPALGPSVPAPWVDAQISGRQPQIRAHGGTVINMQRTAVGVRTDPGVWFFDSGPDESEIFSVVLRTDVPSAGLVQLQVESQIEYHGSGVTTMEALTLRNGELGGVIHCMCGFDGEPSEDVELYLG